MSRCRHRDSTTAGAGDEPLPRNRRSEPRRAVPGPRPGRNQPAPPSSGPPRGGPDLRKAVEPDPQRHRDGCGRPRRPPRQHPGRGDRHSACGRASRTSRGSWPVTTGSSGPGSSTTPSWRPWPRSTRSRSSTCCPTWPTPARLLADLLTLRQRWGGLTGSDRGLDRRRQQRGPQPDPGLRPWPGSNVRLACPPGHELDPVAVDEARGHGCEVRRHAPTRPRRSAGADAVCTDVWVSMGQEAERSERQGRLRRLPGRRGPDGQAARRTPSSCTACPPTADSGGERRGDRRSGQRGVGPGREPHARGPGVAPVAGREAES